MARSVASVTCTLHTRWSHSGDAWQMRSSSARSGSTGTLKSSHRNTVPRMVDEVWVQFSNGFSINQVSGTIMRRSSQMRTTTYVPLISSTRPHSPLTISTSSMRIGCENAICRPAIKLPSTGRAAIPATRPATPAEASKLAPIWRAPGRVSRIKDRPRMMTMACALRVSTRAWVIRRRARRLSATSTGLICAMVRLSASMHFMASQVSATISATLARCDRPTRPGVSPGAPASTMRRPNMIRHSWLARNATRVTLVVNGRPLARRLSRLMLARCTAMAIRVAIMALSKTVTAEASRPPINEW